VVGPRWDYHPVAVVYQVLFFLVKYESGFAPLDAKELIDVGVNFVADLLARLKAHHDELRVLGGEKDLPEVGVL
jgi:hypothetical protein